MKQQQQTNDRICVRLSPYQFQLLTELKDKIGTSYSMLIRTMVGGFIASHEDALERIITGQNIEEDAYSEFASEE